MFKQFQAAVSIQLISPASGEQERQQRELELLPCFHSINFPSEWGVFREDRLVAVRLEQFPFN